MGWSAIGKLRTMVSVVVSMTLRVAPTVDTRYNQRPSAENAMPCGFFGTAMDLVTANGNGACARAKDGARAIRTTGNDSETERAKDCRERRAVCNMVAVLIACYSVNPRNLRAASSSGRPGRSAPRQICSNAL